MQKSLHIGIVFLCTIALIWSLHTISNILAPFALAVFIWLVIDTFARWLDGQITQIPYSIALTLALILVCSGFIVTILIISDTLYDIIRKLPTYQVRLNEILAHLDRLIANDAFSFNQLNQRFGFNNKLQKVLAGFATTIQAVLSNFVLIIIYVAFLFATQASFPKKIDELFPNPKRRSQISAITIQIRASIQTYIGVQTLISLLQTILSYIAMIALGLENALFWALVIFILNYIPIIGGLAAICLPVMFAIIQFDSLTPILLLTAILFAVQFIIGNSLQPKLMGQSMNLSALVVLLSLALWGALWGGVGVFLSAPLTVITMIILAQFPTTRPIAILLSANGQPGIKH